MNRLLAAVALSLAFSCVPAVAVATTDSAAAATEADAAALRAKHEALRDQLARKKEPFKHIDAKLARELASALDGVLARLQGVERTADLADAQRIELLDAIASVESLVIAAEDQRQTCERVASLGSRVRTVVCKSVAQRREEAKQAELLMSEGQGTAGSN